MLATLVAVAATISAGDARSRASQPDASRAQPSTRSQPAAPRELPETSLSYSIEVSLDPETRMLAGRETIRWTNPSSRTTVTRVPVHLYLNAFANDASTWMRSVPTDLADVEGVLAQHSDPWGWSEPTIVRQGDAMLQWRPIQPDDGNPLDRSLVEIQLARPVGPGETLVLDVEFDARLPVPIARTGGLDDFFMVAQWFPKIAAFEAAGVRGASADGWNAHQFHGLTEFYANYADFDVRIGVPAGWKVAATGEKASEETQAALVWHRYRQRAVHDFAFATGSGMVDLVSGHDPAGDGGRVELHLFVPRARAGAAARWRAALEGALDVLGARVGPYPYATVTLVQPPYKARATGGMEYPTLFTGAFDDDIWDAWPIAGARVNEFVIAHEFAHQYFYGLVGSNEFEEAFLDEGFSEYWGTEALIGSYPDGLGQLLGRPLDVWAGQQATAPPASTRAVSPIGVRPSYALRGSSAFDRIYTGPALTLKTLERVFGRDTLDRIFAAYYERWRFRHPRLEDFAAVVREVGGERVADFFLEAYRQDSLPDYRIETFSVEASRPVRGEVVTGRGNEPESPKDGGERAGLDPRALEKNGRIVVERVTPGDAARGTVGGVELETVSATRGAADPGWTRSSDTPSFASEVRFTGAGWSHLPVDVELRFADGVTFRETWDGRSPYRVYRFVRPAPLAEARIDPDGAILLDPDPVNNGRRRTPARALAGDWAAWIAGIAQLVAEGLSQWL
jgi:hypothetical protein